MRRAASRLCRALARAFPQEFKNAYGEDLARTAEDAIEPVWRHSGAAGLVRLLADLAIRIPVEYLAELRRDFRHGWRVLASSPGFTAVALISLSLGMCIPLWFFSSLNGTILRDVPGVRNPGELVIVPTTSYPQYQRYRELDGVFSSTLAYIAPVPFGVSLGGRAERTWGHLVTPSYFSTLGVRPFMGGFSGVVVSYRFWQNRLASDPFAIGRTLRINDHPCSIAGVAPKDFLGVSPMMLAADLWMPLEAAVHLAPELAGNALERRDFQIFHVVGRLEPGVSEAAAAARLDVVAQQFARESGAAGPAPKAWHISLWQGGKLVPTRRQDRHMMALPIVLAGLIVLIACANVANMMLARLADRRREIAIRLTLGASRARLVRQLLAESTLLAAGAGIAGFLLTAWMTHWCSQMKMPHAIPVTFDIHVDGEALALALFLTAFTALALGLAPALQATRTDMAPALKEGGTVRLRRHPRLSLRNLLVVSQMAGSLMVLLLIESIVLGFQYKVGEIGFDPRNIHLISVDPVRDGYSGAQAAAFFEKLLERVRRLPSVSAASLTETVPMEAHGGVWFSNPGPAARTHHAAKFVVGKDYFEAMGVPILRGRGFRKEDEANGARAVIVSEALAREVWNGGDPLGRRLETGSGEFEAFDIFGGSSFTYRLGALAKVRAFEVVGVAKDVRTDSALKRPGPVLYFAMRPADYAQPSSQGVTLMVRARPGADAVRAVRREVAAMDDRLTPLNAYSLEEQMDRLMVPVWIGVATYGGMSLFGLILASVGVAGVTAYTVARRRHEIGIRVALGARQSDVLGLVMKEGAVLVAAGTILGLAGTWMMARVLTSSLEAANATGGGVSHAALLAANASLLIVLALAACYVPARRSAGADPLTALRQE